MSNAMRMGKRTLAGVAAGALGLALIPFVASTSAQAAPNATGTAGAVRAGAIGSIPYGLLVVPKTQAPATTLTVITAPSGARMWVDNNVGDTPVLADDSAALLAPRTFTAKTGQLNATLDDSTYGIAVDTAGSYTASLGNGTDTTTFSFTTRGAPASMTLAPASQTVLVGAPAELAVEVKDAGGNLTQVAVVDTISLSDNTDDTISSTETSGIAALPSLSAAALATGQASFFLRTDGNPAGTTTVTATPQGTLPSLGLTAQTATVTKSGTVATNSVANLTVTAPANAINAGTTSANKTAQVPSPTTSITVTIDDTPVAAAGNQIRLEAFAANGGFVNASDEPVFVNVTTDANKRATATFTLGGVAAVAGGQVTIRQVNVAGTPTNTPIAAQIVVSVKTPAVQPADVNPTPAGIITAVVGATTPVTVQVDDSFGTAQAGWVVNAVRGLQCTSPVVGTGVTSAAGAAQVSVSPAATTLAGQNETYSFCAVNPLTAAATLSSKTLQVNYATNADVTSIAVALGGGNTAGGWSTASPTQTAYPAIFVPSSGTIGATPSTGVYTVASATVTPGNGTAFAALTVTTTPANAVTVSVPEGVKVSSTAPTAATLWSAGSQSATVTGNGSAVYIWATKTGIHDITVSSTGLSLTGKIFVANRASDAYNIALTPAAQEVGIGAIGTATLAVTDIFGNPVQTSTADDSGPVTIAASGQALLAGFMTSNTFTTNASGQATVTFIAGNAAGQAVLTATPKTGSTLPQWRATPAFTPPAGAPAPVLSAVAEIGVGQTPVEPLILIEGTRENRRISFEGTTLGIAEGTEVYPFLRFPGQTGFTQGTAVRTVTIVDEDEQIGEFAWGRNTGKRVAVQFRDADGLRSNTVTIEAR